MFWKNAAWSWDDAAGDDDDDGGFLLAADLRRTPDSAPDADQNLCSNSTASAVTTRSSCPPSALTGPKDPVQHGTASVRPRSLDSANANVSPLFGATQQLPVSTGDQ